MPMLAGRVSDLAGLILSLYLLFPSASVISEHKAYTGSTGLGDEAAAYMSVYMALILAALLFARSFYSSLKPVSGPVRRWSYQRLIAWPLILVAAGITRLLVDSLI